MEKIYYKGFSSAAYMSTGSFNVRDIELVKLDLITHIFTRKRSRVMMVDYGTTIPDMVFEHITDELVDGLHDQLKFVFDYDPRVELLDLVVTPYPDINTIISVAVLRYIEMDVVDTLQLEFNDTVIS